MGKTYDYDGCFIFVVVEERDEWSVGVFCVEGYGRRHPPGSVIEVRHNSSVGQWAQEVK